MSTRVSSATNLSATYFMRNFYSNNRDAMKSSKRKEYSITELAYDDSTALHRAAKKLKNYKYSDNKIPITSAEQSWLLLTHTIIPLIPPQTAVQPP